MAFGLISLPHPRGQYQAWSTSRLFFVGLALLHDLRPGARGACGGLDPASKGVAKGGSGASSWGAVAVSAIVIAFAIPGLRGWGSARRSIPSFLPGATTRSGLALSLAVIWLVTWPCWLARRLSHSRRRHGMKVLEPTTSVPAEDRERGRSRAGSSSDPTAAYVIAAGAAAIGGEHQVGPVAPSSWVPDASERAAIDGQRRCDGSGARARSPWRSVRAGVWRADHLAQRLPWRRLSAGGRSSARWRGRQSLAWWEGAPRVSRARRLSGVDYLGGVAIRASDAPGSFLRGFVPGVSMRFPAPCASTPSGSRARALGDGRAGHVRRRMGRRARARCRRRVGAGRPPGGSRTGVGPELARRAAPFLVFAPCGGVLVIR